MKPYLQSALDVLNGLKTTAEGLTTQEAEKRLAEHGPNKLAEGKKVTMLERFLKQLADPMIIVLLVAAVLSAVTAYFEGEAPTDVFIILAVVLLNAIMGVVQESKAEEAIEALKTMTAANSKCLRDGKLTIVKSEDLVPGDVVLLEAGDSVPADCRIIECASLKIEEAALTGESVPVLKEEEPLSGEEVPLGDRKNMMYMGSTVVYGRGTAVVVDTGMKTEMGKIADALTQAEEEQTPLQVKLAGLSRILTRLVLGICVVMFVTKVIMAGTFNLDVALDSFMLAISLAVAAIPEGLAAVVTIVLSMGVTKMSKRNAVIRRLTAVETLGCAQIICSDKTGTLTQNKMTVVEAYGVDKALLARGMALCSDAELDEKNQAVGEPTECALVNYACAEGLHKDDLKHDTPRVAEAPFDSMRKMMSTLHKTEQGVTQYTKGAPDEILARCTSILTADGVKPMTDADRKTVMTENKRMADKALRVLACAMVEYDKLPAEVEPEKIEKNMTFVGMTGMIDPIRPEVKDAVEKCNEAGIRAIMITGDHIDTAVAIAKDLGLIEDASGAIMGSALNSMSDDELDKVIEKYSVYARVQPEHKVRIVEAWKRKGKITAMTGDGVNDAPSIKAADIGVGMGITGTDVTKNVADMILADDNFATIVSAVEEGRRIYANIRKAIQFLLSSNLSEVISIFMATILGFTILKPAHILWINLITDSIPALALGMEPGERDAMKRKPRDSKAGIFAGGVGFDVAYQGLFVSILTLAAYLIGHFMEAGEWAFVDSPDGMTMAFLTMSMAEIFQSFNMRSRRGSIFKMKSHNKWLWGGAVIALALTTTVIYVPFLRNVFEFEHISIAEYAVAMGLAFLIIPLVELVKFVQRKLGK
ncbi:MAG: calcium-translocating P-type ATPase, PMCA-type [Clostridia bacterium]|nr:calcium-translocating P-type ATPase, PMCA-type [Clostridia bacterium]